MNHPGFDVALVGGAGHVGAPLAILFASKGLRVLVQDIDAEAVATLAAGRMPFREDGAEPLLRTAIESRQIELTTDPARIADAQVVMVMIGTLIDEFGNPMVQDVLDCVEALLPHLSDDQTLLLRSTIVPGVTELVQSWLQRRGRRIGVGYCPERAVQGKCISEIQRLPQIVSGTTERAIEVGIDLFSRVSPEIIRLEPREAELAKLFSNTYRYIQFAISNQFYALAEAEGVDYGRIVAAMKLDYPRLRDMPGAGFAAGPCLHKDTAQLVAHARGRFSLGHAALQINEDFPSLIVDRLRGSFQLGQTTVGLLGMSFKAESDDTRSSLSYRLKKLLRLEAREVLTCDPHVKSDRDLLPIDEVLRRSDVLVLCVPHAAFRDLDARGLPVIDVWGFLPKPAL